VLENALHFSLDMLTSAVWPSGMQMCSQFLAKY